MFLLASSNSTLCVLGRFCRQEYNYLLRHPPYPPCPLPGSAGGFRRVLRAMWDVFIVKRGYEYERDPKKEFSREFFPS